MFGKSHTKAEVPNGDQEGEQHYDVTTKTTNNRNLLNTNNTYVPDAAAGDGGSGSGLENGPAEYDELHVRCPPHTTEKKLMARIDFRILPFMIVLYLLAFLDRVNMANARSFSLVEDLGLTGVQYNTALTVFFVPYILFEIPSNIFLKRLSPRIWLPICGVGFGAVMTFQGLTQNFGGIVATRFFLGLFECGMFPGCFYLIGMWYKRSEAQRRYSLFFGSTSLAGAFGGLLASAIGKMDGIRGYHGWRWIFILEGILTVVVCSLFFVKFPTFPEQAKWLSDDERNYVKARLEADMGRNAAERNITFRDVVTIMKDYKIWLGGFMYFGLIIPAYGYAYFSVAIIQTYHYSPIQTQLRSVPPWAAAFVFAMLVAYASDKTRHRFLFAILPILVAIAGFAILIRVHDNVDLQYAALFLVAMGCYSAMPVIVCWFNMNLGGHHRRAVGTAWQVGFGNIGGIIATYSYVDADRPWYVRGNTICVAFICLSALSCTAYFLACWWENRRREKAAHDVGLTEYEKTELGDLNPEFRYML